MKIKIKFSAYSIAFKLFSIVISFFFPIGTMLYFYISSKNEIIKITKLEINGNKYQMLLDNLLNEIFLHKINVLNKNNYNLLSSINDNILQNIEKLKLLNNELESDLQLTEKDLSKRDRKEYTIFNLEKKL